MADRVYWIDPVTDPRWAEFVTRHPAASVFHTPGWLVALQRTYGHEAVALTTSPPRSEIYNGIPFCRVRSWLTGQRLVSLPFSDHCEPSGRSDPENQGLIDFKDRLGSQRALITYLGYPMRTACHQVRMFRSVTEALIPWMPTTLLRLAGRLLYRHLA